MSRIGRTGGISRRGRGGVCKWGCLVQPWPRRTQRDSAHEEAAVQDLKLLWKPSRCFFFLSQLWGANVRTLLKKTAAKCLMVVCMSRGAPMDAGSAHHWWKRCKLREAPTTYQGASTQSLQPQQRPRPPLRARMEKKKQLCSSVFS